MRRRRSSRRVWLLAALFLLALFPQGVQPAVATPRVTGVTVAKDVVMNAPASSGGSLERSSGAPVIDEETDAAIGTTGEPTLLFTSRVVSADQYFDRVGLRWTAAPGMGETLYPEYRTSADGASWSAWTVMRPAHDLEDLDTETQYVNPQPAVESARFAQYRFWVTTDDPSSLRSVGVTFLDVSDLNLSPLERLASDLSGALVDVGRSYAEAAPVGASRILPRSSWAADESRMKWTPQYKRPHTKVVVHHTVTSDGGTNVAAEIRSMYYFHAVTRGWDDIGYSYLVDKFGNIWTGRQGGDHVEAGHAYGWNNGAIGVAAIGDYSLRPPTSALQGAIANIIGLKFAQYGIQPFGSDLFTHQERRSDGTWIDVTDRRPNVIGHRDATYVVGRDGGQTACPGNTIANMMEGLRRLAQNAVTSGYTNLVRIEPALPRGTFPGASLSVSTKVTNVGKSTIPQGTKLGYQLINARTGGVASQSAPVSLTTALAPGGSATLKVPMTGPSGGTYVVRWDLQTGSSWWNSLYANPVREMWLRVADYDADWVSDTVPSSFTAGETRTVRATIQNTGGRSWPNTGTGAVRVSYKWTSISTGNQFPGASTTALPQTVQPGQTVTVSIPVKAPVYPTNYRLRLDLETSTFRFGDRGISPDDTSIAVLMDYDAKYAIGTVPQMEAGQTVTVPVTITNTGKGTLPTTSAQPVALGYHWYDDRGRPVVYDGLRTKLPTDLEAGKSVALKAQVQAPPTGGRFTLRFDLAHEGVAWFSTKGVPTADRTLTVEGPLVRTYGAAYQPQVTALATTDALGSVPMVLVNESNFTWPAAGTNPIRLSYHWWSLTANKTVLWEGLRTVLPADLPAGGSASVNAQVRFPTEPGSYLLRWDLVEEGAAWFSGRGVPTGDQLVKVEMQVPFVYGSSMLPTPPPSLPVAATRTVPVRVQNLGESVWDGSVNLSYHWSDASGKTVVWDGLRTSLAGIGPSEVREVAARVATPTALGVYTLRWDIVREGHAWFSSQGVQMPSSSVAVELPTYGATYAPGSPSVLAAAGAIVAVPVTVTNTGSLAWQPGTVSLGYHILRGGGTVVWEGARTRLEGTLATGASEVLAMPVRAPQTAGTYTIEFDMVREGVTWFSAEGVPTGSVTLTVR